SEFDPQLAHSIRKLQCVGKTHQWVARRKRLCAIHSAPCSDVAPSSMSVPDPALCAAATRLDGAEIHDLCLDFTMHGHSLLPARKRTSHDFITKGSHISGHSASRETMSPTMQLIEHADEDAL